MSSEMNATSTSQQGAAKPQVDDSSSQRGHRSSSSGSRGPGMGFGSRSGGPNNHRGNLLHGSHGNRGGHRGGREGPGSRDGSQHRDSGRGMSIMQKIKIGESFRRNGKNYFCFVFSLYFMTQCGYVGL